MGETNHYSFQSKFSCRWSVIYLWSRRIRPILDHSSIITRFKRLRDVSESFIIKANTEVENQPREGKITFKSTNSTDKVPSQFVVTVKQAGFIATPPLNVINATATPGAGSIQLQWEIPEDVDFNKIKITYYE